MLNNIKKDNNLLIKNKKLGRESIWITNAGKEYNSCKLNKIEIQCHECKKYNSINYGTRLLLKKYICMSCQTTGEKNSFYGKKHTQKYKDNASKRMRGKYIGEKNPFYGKSHSDETKKKISDWMTGRYVGEKNHFYGKHHSDKTKKILSEKSRKYALANIEKMRSRGIKSAELLSKGRKTIPEKLVEKKLIDMNITFKYNKIIKNVGQFDFIINDDILLEVNGDYWHANPRIYGDGKRLINKRQEYKIKRDIEKRLAVEKLGYKIYYIWEYDIKKGDYSALENILWR